MVIKDIIISSYQNIVNWPKRKLVEAIQILKEWYKELEEQNKAVKEENARLKEELNKQKI